MVHGRAVEAQLEALGDTLLTEARHPFDLQPGWRRAFFRPVGVAGRHPTSSGMGADVAPPPRGGPWKPSGPIWYRGARRETTSDFFLRRIPKEVQHHCFLKAELYTRAHYFRNRLPSHKI